ncbi:MAG TPA: sugar ABC transporter permease [Candidatus Binatia bacterium]|nr:sugar ABC transporter permease [Candidatus Binatia bacterium]
MRSLAARRAVTAWAFLAPMLAVLALIAGWPLLRTILLGFTDAGLGDFGDAQFIGLGNYRDLAADPNWWRAVLNTLGFTLISVTIETLLGLVIALTLDAHLPGRGLVRAAVLIPWAIPTVVSARMWGWMLNDLYGVVNAVLLGLGLIAKPWAWLADPVLSMISVIAVDVWKGTPFMALLSLAALQVLPREIYEAARVDGVHPVRVFFEVTLPLIRPALLVAVVFRSLDAMRVFDVIYVLTGDNPSTASMSVYARQQLIDFQQGGMGSAAATFLFLMVALFAALVVTLGRIRVAGARA